MQSNMYTTELLTVAYQSIGRYSSISHFTQEPIQNVTVLIVLSQGP